MSISELQENRRSEPVWTEYNGVKDAKIAEVRKAIHANSILIMILKSIVLFSTLLLFTACVQPPTGPENVTMVQRKIETPSGDWYGEIDYAYGSDGKLRHFTYAFHTFTGHDPKTGDFKPTSCVRRYDVTEKGGLVLVSKITTDTRTGAAVERTFYEPEFTHWMTLAEATRERNRDF